MPEGSPEEKDDGRWPAYKEVPKAQEEAEAPAPGAQEAEVEAPAPEAKEEEAEAGVPEAQQEADNRSASVVSVQEDEVDAQVREVAENTLNELRHTLEDTSAEIDKDLVRIEDKSFAASLKGDENATQEEGNEKGILPQGDEAKKMAATEIAEEERSE